MTVAFNYHLSKASIVADALSQKSRGEVSALGLTQSQLIMEMEKLILEVVPAREVALMSALNPQGVAPSPRLSLGPC